MVKKYKHISDSDGHSYTDSNEGSTEMNTENTHPHNRGSKLHNIENVGIGNIHRSSRRFAQEKNYEGGDDMWHM